MNRAIWVCIAASALVATSLNACSSDDRAGIVDQGFSDSGADVSTVVCQHQCSLDGRNVLDTCTGNVVQACAPDMACGGGTCSAPCDAATAERSSLGCDFYMQPPLFVKEMGQSCYASFIVNSSLLPADVTLEYQGKPLDISKSLFKTQAGSATLAPQVGSIAPGDTAILFVSDVDPTMQAFGEPGVRCPDGVTPAFIGDGLPLNTGIGSSYHLTSNVPVSAAAIYPYGGAKTFLPSATLLLPVPTWGMQHFIVTAWEESGDPIASADGQPGAQIVASEDGTDITIDPTVAIEDGNTIVGTAAHTPVTYHLDKGQVLQLKQAQELAGSVVTSTKPTSIFGGSACMEIPATRGACDAALQQLPAFEQWGSEYVGVGYRPRLGNEGEPMAYRIVAARDGTQLDYDPAIPPGAPTTMSAGQTVTFWGSVGNAFVVRTQDPDHAIYLAAYMSGGGTVQNGPPDILGGQDMLGKGDPEFVNVVPAGQYLSSYSFFADPTYGDTSLVVVRSKGEKGFSDVTLDCAGVLTGWQPVGTRGQYEWVRVDLAIGGGPGQTFGSTTCQNGLQRMKSDGAFTATIWGWDLYASYAYPGGLAQRKLVTTALPPIR